MIKFHNLDRRYAEVKNTYHYFLDKIISSDKVFDGPYVSEVEHWLQKYSNRKHALLVTSGTQALSLSLLAAGIGPGDGVIITGYSCMASLTPVTMLGADPILCEIDDCGQMDITSVDIPKHAKALIATGLYGDVHNHDLIESFCKKHNLIYINDAAQSYFSKYKHRNSVELGDIVCLSFAENKPLPSFGTHGAILTNNTRLYTDLLYMRKHGKPYRTSAWTSKGINAHPHENVAAQILTSTMFYLKWQDRRKQINDYYDSEFKDTVPLRPVSLHTSSNYHKYSIMVPDKFKFYKILYAEGVDSECHYPDAFCNLPWIVSDFHPMCDMYAKKSLTIPSNPHMTDSEVEAVVTKVKKCFQLLNPTDF